METSLFEVGGMPYKRQVQAFNVIVDQPDALDRFRRLAQDAESAGKLYALAALLELSPKDAEALRSELARDSDRIFFFNSDVVYERKVRELAELVVTRRLGAELRRSREEVDTYFRRDG